MIRLRWHSECQFIGLDQRAADGLPDDEAGLSVQSRSLPVHQHQGISSEMGEEAGGWLHHKAGAADNQDLCLG